MHRASIKYSLKFLVIAMNDVNGVVPPAVKRSIRYYGAVASKNTETFEEKVQGLVATFNECAKEMEKNIEKSGYTDIAMFDREDVHAYHYEVNNETYHMWKDRMRDGEECVLCQAEQEDTPEARHLTHIVTCNAGVAYVVSKLMPPIGFKEWCPAAVDYVLPDCR